MLAGGALALAKFTRSRAKVSDIPRSCEGKCMHARATRRGHTCHVSAPSVGACTSHQRLPGALPTRAYARVCEWVPGFAVPWARMQWGRRPGRGPRLQQQARRLQARQRHTRRQQARRWRARRRAYGNKASFRFHRPPQHLILKLIRRRWASTHISCGRVEQMPVSRVAPFGPQFCSPGVGKS